MPIASTTAQHSAGRKCCSIQAPSSISAQISAYRAIFWETETSDVGTLNLSEGIQLSIQAFYTRHDGLRNTPRQFFEPRDTALGTPNGLRARTADWCSCCRPPARGQKAECARCCKVLAGSATGRIGAPLALASAALVLLVPATVAPLMLVSTYGASPRGLAAVERGRAVA